MVVVFTVTIEPMLIKYFQDTDLQKKIYPSRLTSMSILPNSSSLEVDTSSSATALFTHGRLAKLELEDGNSLYAKLVVIELAPGQVILPI